ncbi:hypothetical protein [Streptomyces sp. OS603R]|uniref:hypothetical protein n=1 Tax=Streptomyces sp. OS603R TaxID=3035287 RepID=UPI0024354BA8|nr:hypothetical protein [Streptomyces sp. OS603R]
MTAVGGFDVRVETARPGLLGAHAVRLRTGPALLAPFSLDPFFLAACLSAPGNDQRAGTRSSSSTAPDSMLTVVGPIPTDPAGTGKRK